MPSFYFDSKPLHFAMTSQSAKLTNFFSIIKKKVGIIKTSSFAPFLFVKSFKQGVIQNCCLSEHSKIPLNARSCPVRLAPPTAPERSRWFGRNKFGSFTALTLLRNEGCET
jgi:hypothetical protein